MAKAVAEKKVAKVNKVTKTPKATKATGKKPEVKEKVATPAKAGMKVAFDRTGNKGRGSSDGKAFWYLNRTGELSVVTAEASNPELGITAVEIFEPTQAQLANNILCKVRLVTLSGVDDNISIFASNYTEGDIYMQEGGGRKVEKEGQKAVWYRDRKLNDAAKAQILSYVHSLLETE